MNIEKILHLLQINTETTPERCLSFIKLTIFHFSKSISQNIPMETQMLCKKNLTTFQEFCSIMDKFQDFQSPKMNEFCKVCQGCGSPINSSLSISMKQTS